jgi:hypothetical protein
METCDGKLTPNYKYIADLRAANERTKDDSESINAQQFCI